MFYNVFRYTETEEKKDFCVSSMECPEDAVSMKSCLFSTTVEYDEKSVVAIACTNLSKQTI